MLVTEALKVLGMPVGSKMTDIKTRYRKLAMEFHPDKNREDKEAEEKMKRINVAYETCCRYVARLAKRREESKLRKVVLHPSQYEAGVSVSTNAGTGASFNVNFTHFSFTVE
ncbi:DnaJ domain-containing protein [Candidatus Pacearchaeota archaeon]|nr:DnaJ domain-containing protein [Candidatus Pacearchaeota archaeon]